MVAFVAAVAFLGQQATDYSRPELISSMKRYVPGKAFYIGVRMTMSPRWHVYWRNPGDSGQEVRVKWTLPKGWRASEILWPLPSLAEDAGILNFVYADEVVLPVRITPGPGKSGRITADLSWLVCNETCIPGSKRVNLDLAAAPKAVEDSSVSAKIQAALRSVPVPIASKPSATLRGKEIWLTLDGSAARSGSFYAYDPAVMDYAAEQRVEGHSDGVRVRLKVSEFFNSATTKRLRGVFTQYNIGNSSGGPRPVEIDVPLARASGDQL